MKRQGYMGMRFIQESCRFSVTHTGHRVSGWKMGTTFYSSSFSPTITSAFPSTILRQHIQIAVFPSFVINKEYSFSDLGCAGWLWSINRVCLSKGTSLWLDSVRKSHGYSNTYRRTKIKVFFHRKQTSKTNRPNKIPFAKIPPSKIIMPTSLCQMCECKCGCACMHACI